MRSLTWPSALGLLAAALPFIATLVVDTFAGWLFLTGVGVNLFLSAMSELRKGGTAVLHRLLLSGIVAIGIAASTIASAAAQPFTGASAGSAIGQAYALAARIRGFHRWTGSTAPPASYCPTMRAGEAIMVELARLANRAIRYRQLGLALELQRAGDRLSDELDEEEGINDQAGVPYSIYPCPVAQPNPARAVVLPIIERRVPPCRRKADAARTSFDARRTLMQQCLRVPGT